MQDGTRIGTSWARLRPTEQGGIEASCRQVALANEGIGLSASRRQSVYRFDAAGRLTFAELWDHMGNHAIPGIDDKGRDISMVLEHNLVALTVAMIERHPWPDNRTLAALIPEIGAVVDYELKPSEQGWSSNFGEAFQRGSNGAIQSVHLSAAGFEFARARHPFPKWSLTGLAPKNRYRPPAGIRTQEHVLRLDGAPHPATLALPMRDADMTCGCVFIGGSGLHDRHGFTTTINAGYHQLLDGLAAEGIATLRYDRYPSAAPGQEKAEGALDFAALNRQAEDAVRWLRGHPALAGKPIMVAGHSLGGLVALWLAGSETLPDGAILLSTPARPLRDILAHQQARALANAEPDAKSTKDMARWHRQATKALEQDGGRKDQSQDPQIALQLDKLRLLQSVFDLDPLDMVKTARCPIVIVHGSADVQVPVADAESLAEASAERSLLSRLQIETGLDHLLMRNPHTGNKALLAYHDRRRRIPKALIRRLAGTVVGMTAKTK